jgi:hypothetical protein
MGLWVSFIIIALDGVLDIDVVGGDTASPHRLLSLYQSNESVEQLFILPFPQHIYKHSSATLHAYNLIRVTKTSRS